MSMHIFIFNPIMQNEVSAAAALREFSFSSSVFRSRAFSRVQSGGATDTLFRRCRAANKEQLTFS
jgi:hypothetical protein